MFVLSVIQIVITLFIKTEIKNDQKQKYSLKEFIKYVKDNKLKKIQKYSLSCIAYGIVESSISTLIIIITIMTFKTSLNFIFNHRL